MSVATILDTLSGVILQQYLPTNPQPHPYVESITAGSGISVDNTVETAPVVSNTGVLSVSAGTGISLSGTASAPVVSNAGVLSVSAGTGISLSGTASAPVINAEAVKVEQFTGTVASFSVPESGGTNPASTLASFDVSSLGSFNSFIVYLKLNTGVLQTPQLGDYIFQYFLSDTVNGNLDEVKGCLVGYTNSYGNTQSDFQPNTTLLFRSTIPINTIHLNVQVGNPPGIGSQWLNPAWTADVYCSNI
jgi:hypothetical protein